MKKQKITYFDEEDEDHGSSLQVNGHVVATNGKAGKSEKAHAKELRQRAALQEQRKQLPIAKGLSFCLTIPTIRLTLFPSGREALIREFKKNDTVVLVGETGSGKTTRQ